MVVAAAVVMLILLAAVFWFAMFRNACDRFDTVLAKDADGRAVVYKFEACTTIGTSVDARVDLVSASGDSTTIFRFSPADGYVSYRGNPVTGSLEPSAEWLSPHSLKISIGTVAAVLDQRSEVEGVRVTYDIGTNLHVERDLQ
jgi:hypothetical protein